MPRLIAGAALTAITTATGTSPQVLLQIQYTAGVQYFATKSVTVGGTFYDGAIVDVGEVSSEVKKESSTTVGICNLTLSDINGTLKNGIDSTVFEKAIASLYLWYEGTGALDAIPLLVGNICGPIEWDETNRTISFSIESQIENQDVGFAPTQDDFADLDPDAQGVPWPMIFGSCVHVPALKVHRKTIGSLIAPIRFYQKPSYMTGGAQDDVVLIGHPAIYNNLTGTEEANVIYIEGLDKFGTGTIKIQIDNIVFQGSIDATDKTKFNVDVLSGVPQCNLSLYTNVNFGARISADNDFNNTSVAWMPNDTTKIVNCAIYYQWTSGPIYYNYCVRQVGRKCWFRYPFIQFISNSSAGIGHGGVKVTKITTDFKMTEVYPIQKNGMVYDIQEDIQKAKEGLFGRQGGVVGQNPYGILLSALDKLENDANSWYHSSSDSIARPYATSDSDVFIASLVQLAEVKAIYGKRKIKAVNNKTYQVFQSIPDSYYTVQLASSYSVGSTGQFATGIIFTKSLAEYKDQDWEDGIWVSAKSTIGPNPIDIITWIITNFTTLTMDTTGFSTFRSLLRPANFAIFEKRDALQVCEEIAWQSRMGMIVESGKVSLVFLPVKPLLPTVTLTDTAIDVDGGLSLSFTPIRNIVTKILGTWTPTYKEKLQPDHLRQSQVTEIENIIKSLVPDARRSASETQYYLYENHQDKFGNRPRTIPVYIFNTPSPVKELINFWGFRLSNCWRLVRVKGFPNALTVTCFDTIQLAPADVSILSGGPWTGLVVGTRFKFSDMSLTIDVMLPSPAGVNTDLSTTFWPGNTF